MTKPDKEDMAAMQQLLKEWREAKEIELDETKHVISEDGKVSKMLHRLKTESLYTIDDLLNDDHPDFFALAILQWFRVKAGEIEEPDELPKALDVVAKGSKVDKGVGLRQSQKLLETLLAAAGTNPTATAFVGDGIVDYLLAYLTYRSRLISCKE